MKLLKFAENGRDKLVAGFSSYTSIRGNDNRVKTINLWFSKYQRSESTHWVEITRAEANHLRDYLNTMLPEAADSPENWAAHRLNQKSLDRAAEKPGSDISPAMVKNLAWKGGEYHYCVSICRSAGDGNVPRDSVKDYLFLQSSLADSAGELSICEALWSAATILDNFPGRFSKAFVYLVDQREKIAKESES